jgi:general secretion pathway protein D
LNYRLLLLLLMAFSCWAGGDPVAAKLARSANEARNSGRLVRAYMLFAEAAARDPQNPTYRANRDALAPIAKLLSKANVETADISGDIKAAQANPNEPDVNSVLEAASEKEALLPALQPLPAVKASSALRNFDLDADEKVVLSQVAAAYGVRALWDRDLQTKPRISFHLAQADFHTAMEALTAATDTFVFPVNAHLIFFANDTETKRAELEPTIALTVPLPNALDQRDLTEAANAVRGVLGLRSVGYDSASRMVVIHDRASRARLARSLLEALLLPKSQVSIEVELMTFDTDRSYHYGVALPTSYQMIDYVRIGGFQSILSAAAMAGTYLTFGGGSSLFGIGGINATLFATYSKSVASKLFDATVVASDGQQATLHVGDRYPIPQSIYGGFQQSAGSLYNPIGQVTYQDLGLLLKMKPHVSGSGDISLEVEAQDDALGTQTIDTVPEIAERIFKGNITLREGEWAIIAGLDANTNTNTRSGLPGLAQIPGVDEVLAENTRDRRTSKLLLVIKPTITRLPMSDTISPQYLVGPHGGERVIL